MKHAFSGGCLAAISLLTSLWRPAPAAAFSFPSPTQYQQIPAGQFEWIEEDCDRDFDARLVVRRAGSGEEGRLRFNWQQSNEGYELRWSADGARLVKVEAGLEFPLVECPALAPTGDPLSVVLKRRQQSMVLVAGGEIVARAYDATFSRGALGCRNGSVRLDDVRVQPVPELFYSDDFMKPAGEMGEWEALSGQWQINSLDNPVLSINAFSMMGSAPAGAGVCAAGHWFWDNYRYAASVSGDGQGALGIAFCVSDASNYYAFRWEPIRAEGDGARRQLLRVREGQSTVIDEARGGYLPGQWYRLQADVAEGEVRVSVDGTQILSAESGGLNGGEIGLYVEGAGNTFFDDVSVTGLSEFFDGFDTETAGAWSDRGGKWALLSREDEGQQLAVHSSSVARRLLTAKTCRNFTSSVRLHLQQESRAGLFFHYVDPLNYYEVAVDAKALTLSLSRCLEGEVTDLGSVSLVPLQDRFYELALTVDAGHFVVSFRGLQLLEAFDASLEEGKVGLFAERADPVLFDSFQLRLVDRENRSPVYTAHEVFAAEKSMEDWAAAQSDWITAPQPDAEGTPARKRDPEKDEAPDTRPPGPYWHRADFYGEVELQALLGDLSAAGSEVRLIAGAEELSAASGYSFVLRQEGGLKLELRREDKVVASAPYKGATPPAEMGLRRCGKFVVGLLDQRPVLVYGDSNPIRGITVGYNTEATTIAPEDLTVYADDIFTYTFQQATTDWRVANGIWEVTNRWECDPRWSFFSGRSDDVAAIWNKRVFRGDTTLEFCGATKMNRSKQGKGQQYDYAADINATVCADGQDLRTGYNFVFGGWHNEATRLLKGTEVLAESKEYLIPSREMNIHHLWFYLKIQKRGNRLRFWIDNNLVFDVEDPEPLTGSRLALWTQDNGMMVARVRISTHDGSRCELLDRLPNPQVKCIYDES